MGASPCIYWNHSVLFYTVGTPIDRLKQLSGSSFYRNSPEKRLGATVRNDSAHSVMAQALFLVSVEVASTRGNQAVTRGNVQEHGHFIILMDGCINLHADKTVRDTGCDDALEFFGIFAFQGPGMRQDGPASCVFDRFPALIKDLFSPWGTYPGLPLTRYF